MDILGSAAITIVIVSLMYGLTNFNFHNLANSLKSLNIWPFSQFGENILKIKAGNGGYLVTLFAIFTGFAGPFGGKIIDRFSVKKVLITGFTCTILGTLYQAFITANNPTFINLFIGLVLMGFGMGFTMGTPVNYLMMSLVPPDEISSEQSTVSLIRSISVAISPNILVNFISDAGSKVPDAIQKV